MSSQSLSASFAPASSVSKTFPEQVWEWLACFRSIPLAIILLSLLASGTLIGVLMPQESLVDPYDIRHQFGPNYRILKSLGFFNVYSSYWFLSLEVMFFFNLLFGSFQWLRPAWNAATRRDFCQAEHIAASPNHFQLSGSLSPSQSLQNVRTLLKKHGYSITQDVDQKLLYAHKASFSRMGPAVAHVGILLLLIASLYGAFTGFKAQKLIVPGESFLLSQTDVFTPNMQQTFWQGNIPDWRVHVKDFRIETYPDHPETIQQYYANISVSDNASPDKKLLAQNTISVNHPLSLGDLTIYQASYQPTGKLFLEVNGKPMAVSTNTEFNKRPASMTPLGDGTQLLAFPFFVQQDPGVTKNFIRIFIQTENGFLGAAPGKMPKNLKLTEGSTGQIGPVTVRYVRPEIATGLQIKKAPEVPLMYLSYLIIAMGTVMCFFSQRQLWVAICEKQKNISEIFIQFRTNKAKLSFLKELEQLQSSLHKTLTETSNA